MLVPTSRSLKDVSMAYLRQLFVTKRRRLEDNDQEDLRQQDTCERNLANYGKGLVLALLQISYRDLDVQRRRFINQWNEFMSFKKDSTQSR